MTEVGIVARGFSTSWSFNVGNIIIDENVAAMPNRFADLGDWPVRWRRLAGRQPL